MDGAIRDGWVSALRSPFYPQGRDRLRSRSGHYCPFGVLCDMLHRDRWIGMVHYGYLDPSGDIYWVLTPPSIMAEAGLLQDDEEWISAMVEDGCSFEEISSYIEKL